MFYLTLLPSWGTSNFSSFCNQNIFTAERLYVPFVVCSHCSNNSSSPRCTSTTLPNGYQPRFTLSSFISNKSLILICSFCAVHFDWRVKDSKYSCNQHFQKWSDNIWTWCQLFSTANILVTNVIYQTIIVEIPSYKKMIKPQCF